MKEYEEQLGNLKKENFSLKLRIYFLEERMGQKYDKEDKEELYKTNIELKVETEALKQELYDKQELVRQASTALSGLEQQFQEQVAQIKDTHEQEREKLQSHVQQLQKEVEEHESRVREEKGRLGELTQLCGLAFSTGAELEQDIDVAPQPKNNLSLPVDLPGYNDSYATQSSVQGIFSMPTVLADSVALEKSQLQFAPDAASGVDPEETPQSEKVASLEAQVAELEDRVTELEGELAAREETACILEGDLANLRKELEDKVEKIAELEVEVTEKELKIDDVMQELETRHMEIQAKDDQIQSLHHDLNRVEPEIEVKVQEIVERDRIIEQKIEQIEQQNKILVEIQITLDEKQKQIADMEQKITESSEKIKKLTEELDKSCKVIQTFAEEVQARDKEILTLKKELKRKEKKIRDLVAELKEALDMLNKAKWEAETSGGEDGVKEMAEEENERLWAELESRKNEVLALRAEHKHSLSEAEGRLCQLQERLKELETQRDERREANEERETRLRDGAQRVALLEGELEALRGDASNREGLLRANQGVVKGLEEELAAARELLKEKRSELDAMQEEVRKKNADMQDLVNRELWERNREVERLQEKLGALTADHRQRVELLRDELSAKDGELRRLDAKLRSEGAGRTDGPAPAPANSVASDASLTVLASPGNTDVTVNRPLHLTVSDDGTASVQILYQEMCKIRSEAQALRLERSALDDKLSSMQRLYDQACRASGERPAEGRAGEEPPEDIVRGETSRDFQLQIQVLQAELQNAKRRINEQLTEVGARKYQEALRRHRREVASLRKRLADSHDACDLLRTRLEELADFLERVLEMEEKGLINLSQMSPKQLALLHRTLDESRALSRSLSQSLMIGADTSEFADASLLPEGVSETLDVTDGTLLPEDSGDLAVRELASQLNAQIDSKAREIEAIAESASSLADQLAQRTLQVEQKEGTIAELRGEVGRLQEEVRSKDLQLVASRDDSWLGNPLEASSQSTVHAASPQTAVRMRDSSDGSYALPPPPLHLLQDSDASEAKDARPTSDPNGPAALPAKGAYSTDAAVGAYAQARHFQENATRCEQQQSRPKPVVCAVPEQPWVPVSPSESEAWSEPDRNVSLARMGLDACALSTDRTRPQRAFAVTSESDGEGAREDNAAASGKAPKRRSDVAELRRVSAKLRAVEQLNDTLRAELNIYQTLSQRAAIRPTEERRPKTSDKSVETSKGETADASVGAGPPPPSSPPAAAAAFAVPAPLLEEIRALRLKLEEAISNNDHLRDQLEAALTAHPQDEARFHYLNAALQIAQEEMREARDRVQTSQAAACEQRERCDKVQHRLQESEDRLKQCQERLEASQAEASSARAELRANVQERESLEGALREATNRIARLEADAEESSGRDGRARELQAELQRQEARLLRVNKERLSLVGERALLQAQLASASTQARLLRDSEGADAEPVSTEEVASLRRERQQLLSDRERLEKKVQVLQEEVACLQSRTEHLTSRRAREETRDVESSALLEERDRLLADKERLEGEVRVLQEEAAGLRAQAEGLASGRALAVQEAEAAKREAAELRDDRTRLLGESGSLEAEVAALREKQSTVEDAQLCLCEQKTLLKQLTAQLESERCLTTNLQQQLDTFRASTSPSTSHCDDSVVPNASDRASHESVASIEFFRPAPDRGGVLQRYRAASLSPTAVGKDKSRERRALSGGRRRDSKRNAHWREDKENLLVVTATTGGRRNRRPHGGDSTWGVPPRVPRPTEEEGDGGTTSGESPDLGIGSDYHFSSLERGTRTLRSLVHSAHDLPPPSLCSESSHSTLSVENQQLRIERDTLTAKLASTKDTLKEALEKLAKVNQRKENVERAICKQLYKTHDVLKKAKTHLKQANSQPQ